MDGDIRCLTLKAAERLVDHHARVRQRISLAGFARGQQQGAHQEQAGVSQLAHVLGDLADLTVEQLVEHANRVRTIMTPGEKSTARTAIAASNVEFLVGILQRVAEREAGKP